MKTCDACQKRIWPWQFIRRKTRTLMHHENGEMRISERFYYHDKCEWLDPRFTKDER